MKNPNELRKYIIFQLNECDAIKEYLEEMALQGWGLKYITTFFCFEKIEPQKLIYSVEVFSKASVYDTVPAKSTNEYIEYCKEAGWSFVCNMGQINIFKANSQNAIPIETDEQLKFKTIKRGILKQNTIVWFCLTPLFVLNIILNFINFESSVTSNMGLYVFFIKMIFFAVVIIQVISFIVWNIKQSKNLKRGNPIQYISKSGRKKRTILQLIPLFIMILLLLLVAFFSLVQRDYFTLMMIVFILLLVPLVILVSYSLQKSGLSRTANKIIPVLLGVGISFISIIIVSIFMIILSKTDSSLQDNSSFSSKTFLASTVMYDYVTENNEEISVTIFKSNFKPIINQYLYSKTHIFFVDDFNTVSLPEWNTETSYISRSRYFVKFDTYIISFYRDEVLTKADIAKIKSLVE